MDRQQRLPLSNQILYTSSDGKVINPAARYFSAILTSNTYEDGVGVIQFNRPVSDIGWNAFMGCTTLTSLSMPLGVVEIADGACSGCTALEQVVVPDSVTKIGNRAFAGCTALRSISIPESVSKIGEDAFDSATVVIRRPKAMPVADEIWYTTANHQPLELPEYTAEGGVVTNSYRNGVGVIKFSAPLTELQNCAFYNCAELTSVILPKGMTSVGNHTFSGCSALTSVTVPDSVEHIGICAFEGCSALKNIDLGRGVQRFGEYAFGGCLSLKSLALPDGVQVLSEGLFFGCKSLTTLYLGQSVNAIETHAFERCGSLQRYYLRAAEPQFSSSLLPLSVGVRVYVLNGSLECYKGHADWGQHADRIYGYDPEN
ncbi:MAG: leucine-rich repeat domain-containing protein [Alistipes sp.]|nr:leucine-rich repeat domain-containing protein [Alistipes sp.]